jgi:hypothetical protein
MRTRLILTVLAAAAVGVAAAIAAPGNPVSYSVSNAKIKDNTVSMPVTNLSMDAIDVEVVVYYDDGDQVHTGSQIVSLAPKGTELVVLAIQTITDDIDPQAPIVDSETPVANSVAISAALSN